MENRIDFEVYGDKAMFTSPISRGGSCFFSYPLPTQEAIKGLAKHIYWKPSFCINVERVRVMNEISYFDESRKLMRVNNPAHLLAKYMYLSRPRYQVTISLELNEFADREKYKEDFERGIKKHYEIFERVLNRGGNRMPLCFGTSECIAIVKPCVFGEGEGFYDNLDFMSYGIEFFGYDYPGETGKNGRYFAEYIMKNGILNYNEFQKLEDIF